MWPSFASWLEDNAGIRRSRDDLIAAIMAADRLIMITQIVTGPDEGELEAILGD